MDSPSDRIRYTDRFRDNARNLPADRYRILNERIDDFVRHLEMGEANLRRLRVKMLKGNPLPPSTHEAYAWSDADCSRIFFHYQDNVAVFDRLDVALH